ncbi:MAG: hypothetical protein ABI361_05450 [Nitrososphaera sp.]|jgi:hypothetical protein
MVSEDTEKRDTPEPAHAYSCEICLIDFESAKEMVRHYKERHPDSMESITLPI